MNGPAREQLLFDDGAGNAVVGVEHAIGGVRLTLGERQVGASGGVGLDQGGEVILDGRVVGATVYAEDNVLTVILPGETARLTLVDPAAMGATQELGGGAVTAPMPGKVIQVACKAGVSVKRGTPLMVVEAMKMEHTIAAPADGAVASFHFGVGDFVEEGAVLLDFDLDDEN